MPLPSTPEPQPERAPGGGKYRPDPIALPQELRQSTPAASPQQRRGTPLALPNGKGVALSVNGEVAAMVRRLKSADQSSDVDEMNVSINSAKAVIEFAADAQVETQEMEALVARMSRKLSRDSDLRAALSLRSSVRVRTQVSAAARAACHHTHVSA